jgi:hypothetical protein
VIRIEVVTSNRSGFIIAVDTAAKPGTAHVVGQVHQASIDGEPERWTAWLWPAPGQYTTGHAEAVTVKGKAADLREKLSRRHQARGAWWTA